MRRPSPAPAVQCRLPQAPVIQAPAVQDEATLVVTLVAAVAGDSLLVDQMEWWHLDRHRALMMVVVVGLEVAVGLVVELAVGVLVVVLAVVMVLLLVVVVGLEVELVVVLAVGAMVPATSWSLRLSTRRTRWITCARCTAWR